MVQRNQTMMMRMHLQQTVAGLAGGAVAKRFRPCEGFLPFLEEKSRGKRVEDVI